MASVEIMSKEVYVAAVKGNIEFLQQTQNDAYLLTKTYENNTIIHIAVQHEQYEFLQQSLERFAQNQLICEKNSWGNTALHVAGEVGNLRIVTLLCEYCAEYDDDNKPWKLKNLKGNTPIHVAIMHHNVKIARFLLEIDSSLACIVNDSKEAPLHLAIKHHVNYSESESVMAKIKQPIDEGGAALTIKYIPGEDMSSMIKLLIEKGSCTVTCWPDAKGWTPLHAAASLSTPYNLEVIRSILYHCPQSAEVCDKAGKSILHLLICKLPSYHEGINLLKFKEIYALRNHQDHQGNTPLHLAARNMDIHMVRVLLESSAKLSIKNMEGLSVASFIQQQKLLQVEECIEAKKEMLGVRSVWGIPTIQLKNYVSTMGIIAALITTITFTTAFTVPGGLFQDKGTPIFLKKAAFQVFMISDVVAMCLSMIVLFCLLWIMAAGNRHNSLMILDFSVSLLLASFFATLLTFMTGLYAVMYPIKPWIAFVALGLCSLIMLLAHKFLVLKLLIPFGKLFTVFIWWLRDFSAKLCTKLSACYSIVVSSKQGRTASKRLPINV